VTLDTGLSAVIFAARKVGGVDPQVMAQAEAALHLKDAVFVRRFDVIHTAGS
jgi:hypothetical protein